MTSVLINKKQKEIKTCNKLFVFFNLIEFHNAAFALRKMYDKEPVDELKSPFAVESPEMLINREYIVG